MNDRLTRDEEVLVEMRGRLGVVGTSSRILYVSTDAAL